MTDRSHLTPTQTVDRRGRATTVFRNLNGSAPASPRPSLPKATLASAAPHPAPADRADRIMRQPSKRSRPEMAAFLTSVAAKPEAQQEQIAAVLAHADGRAAAALAMDLVGEGLLDPGAVLGVLLMADAERPSSEPLDALRLAALFQPRAAELDAEERRGRQTWIERICWAVSGYRHSEDHEGRAVPALATREQLDSCASVTDFVLRFDSAPNPDVLRMAFSYTKVGSPALERYLREGPYDPDRISRIAEYVNEHGMDRDDPEVVYRMRGVLDGGTGPALGDGWL